MTAEQLERMPSVRSHGSMVQLSIGEYTMRKLSYDALQSAFDSYRDRLDVVSTALRLMHFEKSAAVETVRGEPGERITLHLYGPKRACGGLVVQVTRTGDVHDIDAYRLEDLERAYRPRETAHQRAMHDALTRLVNARNAVCGFAA